MKVINKNGIAPFASYTGYTKNKKYRVKIDPIDGNKELEFTSIRNIEDIKTVLGSYIEDVGEEKDFHFLIRLNQENENICYANYKVCVAFEDTNYLFFPPETTSFFTEKGEYVIETEATYHHSLAYTGVWDYDDYPVKIMELMSSFTTENSEENEVWDANITMPIFILLICYSADTDLFETLPIKLNISFRKREKIYDSKITQKTRIFHFRNFSENLYNGKLVQEKISRKK